MPILSPPLLPSALAGACRRRKASLPAAVSGAFHLFHAFLLLRRLRQQRQQAHAADERHRRALAEARARERERIARELHDTLLQSVHSTLMLVEAGIAGLPPDAAARARLERALHAARLSLHEAHDRIRGLRRPRPPRSGPRGALREESPDGLRDELRHALRLVQEAHPASALRLGVSVSGDARAIRPEVGDELIVLAREAVRNAYRHAGGTRVRVELRHGAAQVRLRVTDDGRGIGDPARALSKEDCWGLRGMRERVAALGGRFRIDSRPGAGTRVTIAVPARLAYGGKDRTAGRDGARAVPPR